MKPVYKLRNNYTEAELGYMTARNFVISVSLLWEEKLDKEGMSYNL